MLPGIYTVKMTKADKVYTTQLNVTLDPRASYTLDDRKAQFDLVVRLSALLNHMSWAVDAIIGIRDITAAAVAGNLLAKRSAAEVTRAARERRGSDPFQNCSHQVRGRA